MKSLEKLLEGKKVLIVDDDVRNIFALSNYLETIGLDILTTESGASALDILFGEEQQIAIVLLDMMMPEIDGFEVLEKVRGNKTTSSLPVISVTAKAMKGDREKCLEAGATEYVSKPVDINELVDKMSRVIN